MNEQLYKIIKEGVTDADLTLGEIPRIDLYLDQILNLVSEKNAEGSDRYKDRILTKTMINNYSKEGAILPIQGKKYNRMQVIQILFLYSLKSSLSIGEIKRIFEGVFSSEGFDEGEFESLYNDYLTIKAHSREEIDRIAGTVVDQLASDPDKDGDYIRLILSFVALSSYCRAVAEAMIDARYPAVLAADAEGSEKPKKATKSEKVAAKAEKVAEKAEKVAAKSEKIAAKSERIAAKSEKIAEKETAKAEKRKAKEKD